MAENANYVLTGYYNASTSGGVWVPFTFCIAANPEALHRQGLYCEIRLQCPDAVLIKDLSVYFGTDYDFHKYLDREPNTQKEYVEAHRTRQKCFRKIFEEPTRETQEAQTVSVAKPKALPATRGCTTCQECIYFRLTSCKEPNQELFDNDVVGLCVIILPPQSGIKSQSRTVVGGVYRRGCSLGVSKT